MWNVGTGNSQCEQHRALIATHWPVVITMVYLFCHGGTFAYVFYYYSTVKPWLKADVALLCLIGVDRVAFVLMVTYSVFHSMWMLYGAASVVALPILIDGISIAINRTKFINTACARWTAYIEKRIRNLLEHKDLSTWFFHNLNTGLKNGLLLLSMDLIWPALRISILLLVFSMSICFQVCLSCADMKCVELWRNKTDMNTTDRNTTDQAVTPLSLDGPFKGAKKKTKQRATVIRQDSQERVSLEGGRVRVSVSRAICRIVLQGAIICTNYYMIGRSVLEPIRVFGFGYFPSTSFSLGLSASVLIYLLLVEYILAETLNQYSATAVCPTARLENESKPPISQSQVAPTPQTTEISTLPPKSTAIITPTAREEGKAPPLKIRDEIVAGANALHRERQEYRQRRASTTTSTINSTSTSNTKRIREFGRSVSFDINHAQTQGYHRSSAFAHDMEVVDV